MSETKPTAREGLLTHDHSKRGRRYVTILDPVKGRVVLLEPWEHAILVLSDGTRTAKEMIMVIDHPIEGEKVDLKAVHRTLRLFELQELIVPGGFSDEPPLDVPGARTLAGLQQAYREYHKDPVKTEQILSGLFQLSFPVNTDTKITIGLEPTVALTEEHQPERPSLVAIGTTLVVGDDDDVSKSDKKSMKSLLDAPTSPPPSPPRKKGDEDEPETLVGSAKGEADVARGEFEVDELELGGKLSELLAAVDNDFAEVEKRELKAKEDHKKKKRAPPPPVGKPIGGVAEVPRAKSLAQSSLKVSVPVPELAKPRVLRAPTLPPAAPDPEVLVIPDEPTMRSIPYSEAALNPTMVGRPAEEGGLPILLAPARNSSKSNVPQPQASAQPPLNRKASVPGEARIGATVSPGPTAAKRNVSTPIPPPEPADPAQTIEDTMRFLEANTEGQFETEDPRNDTGPMLTARDDEPTTEGSDHIAPGRARDVFERLRKAGLKARSYSDDSLDQNHAEDHPARRKDDKAARRFEQALVSLTAGDLELALAHFRALLDQMPKSKRVRGFTEAIEAVRGEQTFKPSILEDFEAALEDAIAYGRCPKCFSMMAAEEAECFACGFRLSRTITGRPR